LQKAAIYLQVDEHVYRRASQSEKDGCKALDALHIACAELEHCDYFITCDDKLIKSYHNDILIVQNPIHFILNLGQLL